MLTLNAGSTVLKATNCTGPMQRFHEQRFMIMNHDVGTTHAHYLGYKHKTYTFTEDDVGRTIVRTAQEDYQCWWFSPVP
jgi:hypothetical protein